MKLEKKTSDAVKTDMKQVRIRRFRKILAMFLVAVVSVFTVSEVITFAIWAMPLICLQIWQMSNVGALASLAITELTVTNVAVLVMMWLLPCLFLGGVCLYLHIRLVRFVGRKLRIWLSVLRQGPDTVTEN